MTRRICKLADKNNRKNVDLRDYEDIILDVINEIAPNKNPKVEEHSFSSDPLTQSQAVRLGLALSAIPDLAVLGKTITTFRLFDGRVVEDGKTVTSKATKINKAQQIRIRRTNNMADTTERKYLTVREVQLQYLPVSQKRIRAFLKQYLNVKVIGGRIFVERQQLEKLLTSPDREYFPIKA